MVKKMVPKNVKFPPKLLDRAEEYWKDNSYGFSGFSELVRDALEFYIDFWYSDQAVELMFRYIDRKVDSPDFEIFVKRVFLRIQEYQIKNPDKKITDLPFWPDDINTTEYMKKMEKLMKEQIRKEMEKRI